MRSCSGSDETFRAFIALELPEDAKTALIRLQTDLRRPEDGIKWVAEGNLHLTLLFLGEMPKSDLAVITERLETIGANHAPFEMVLKGAGAFPNVRRPKTIWAGIVGDLRPLRTLAESVASEMAAMGYPPDKSFKPHVTLGRSRADAPNPTLADALTLQRDRPLAEARVDSIRLFKSELRPQGPIYSPLATVALKEKAS
jgi:2'-5' RNA ligase